MGQQVGMGAISNIIFCPEKFSAFYDLHLYNEMGSTGTTLGVLLCLILDPISTRRLLCRKTLRSLPSARAVAADQR